MTESQSSESFFSATSHEKDDTHGNAKPTKFNSTSSSGMKRTGDDKFKGSSHKKPRYNRSFGNRRGGAGYTKSEIPITLRITPNRTYFPVYCSNLGIPTICSSVHGVMSTRDHRINDYVPLHILKYVTNLSWLHRMVQIAWKSGIFISQDISLLKRHADSLIFPPILCDYIESFGQYRLSNGTTLVPRVLGYDDWMQTTFPIRGGHPIFSRIMWDVRALFDEQQEAYPENYWLIHQPWIQRYHESTSRANRTGMVYRRVNDLVEGTTAMCTALSTQHFIAGHSCQEMSDPECQLGSSYRMRIFEDRGNWPGEYNHLIHPSFTSTCFSDHELTTTRTRDLMLPTEYKKSV